MKAVAELDGRLLIDLGFVGEESLITGQATHVAAISEVDGSLSGPWDLDSILSHGNGFWEATDHQPDWTDDQTKQLEIILDSARPDEESVWALAPVEESVAASEPIRTRSLTFIEDLRQFIEESWTFANPNHDARGRFARRSGTRGGSVSESRARLPTAHEVGIEIGHTVSTSDGRVGKVTHIYSDGKWVKLDTTKNEWHKVRDVQKQSGGQPPKPKPQPKTKKLVTVEEAGIGMGTHVRMPDGFEGHVIKIYSDRKWVKLSYAKTNEWVRVRDLEKTGKADSEFWQKKDDPHAPPVVVEKPRTRTLSPMPAITVGATLGFTDKNGITRYSTVKVVSGKQIQSSAVGTRQSWYEEHEVHRTLREPAAPRVAPGAQTVRVEWYHMPGRTGTGTRLSPDERRELADIQNKLGMKHPEIKFDLTGSAMSVSTAKVVHDQIDELLTAYPGLRKSRSFQAFKTGRGGSHTGAVMSSNTYAHVSGFGQTMVLNTEFFGQDISKLDTKYNRDETTKWHPPSNAGARSIVTHEFGHVIDYAHKIISKQTSKWEWAQGDMGNTILQVQLPMHRSGKISKYAETNEKELFAEVFAVHHHNPTWLTQEAGVSVVNQLQSVLKAVK